MHQVHGANVAVVDEATPCGAELRGADGLVTALPGRALGVLSADCVPVLLAGDRTIAVAHAGRVGVTADVVAATLATATELGEAPVRIRAVIGPAIGGCCYEVPGALRDEVGRHAPAAPTTTDRGTPGLDLPAAVAAQLADAGVTAVDRVGGCTRCDPEMRWFSHRRDPGDGRQLALIVRHEEAA
jgi:YfiH family protein